MRLFITNLLNLINSVLRVSLTASLSYTRGTLSLTICSNLEGASGITSAIPFNAECTRISTWSFFANPRGCFNISRKL
ncbi:hypothetical protein HanPSC8_Chr09g0393981 [Helianthus annuus]|nr:hypothetical protein HanPSC8_Chr09g0393981 [Helianthus annuus]